MGATPFNTCSILPAQVLGVDGQYPAAVDNPLPVSLNTASLPAGTNPLGKINFNATAAVLSSVTLGTTINANTTLTFVTGTASQVVNVYRMILSNSTASVLTFRNGTNSLSGSMSFGANGSLKLDLDGEPWFVTGAGASFNVSSSDTTTLGGRLYYLQA